MKEIPRESNHAMTCVWLGWIEGRSDIMREMPKVLKVFPSYSLRLLFDLPTPSNIVYNTPQSITTTSVYKYTLKLSPLGD